MRSVLERIEQPHFNLEKVRSDFHYLNLPGDPIIYLDNAATSQRPEQVIKRMTEFYRSENGNPLRGAHRLGAAATEAMMESRQKVASFINSKSPSEIIFTKNASEALNLVAYSWGIGNLQSGDQILITRMEHHSNCVNWQFVAQKTGAELIYIELNDDYQLDMDDYKRKLSEKTKIVAFSAASNVLGTIPDSKKIIAMAKEYNALTVVDAAQYVSHAKLDVQDWACDFLVFSGHKMLGPMGIGVLYGRKELLEEMSPFLYGGEMIEYVEDQTSTYSELPYKFEAGTQDIAGMVGLVAAIEYLESIGLDAIADYENALADYCIGRMLELDYIEIYHVGSKANDHTQDHNVNSGPAIAFNVAGAHPHDVSTILDFHGVAIRAGHHCTQPLHRWLAQNSTCRVSIAFYNTKEEVDLFIDALADVRKVMRLDD
ncbi:MAG TPA: SufS family cysteine desulfurase [Candidatus Eisenbacteria bacterium]|nr:SufS family cysteine desulfurase [Candidatus Eisenbacteria bacterium]